LNKHYSRNTGNLAEKIAAENAMLNIMSVWATTTSWKRKLFGSCLVKRGVQESSYTCAQRNNWL